MAESKMGNRMGQRAVARCRGAARSVAVLLLLIGWPCAGTAHAADANAKLDDSAQASMQAFRSDVIRMQGLVAACAANAAACDAAKVAGDEQVGDVAHGGFEVHWAWLRHALDVAKNAKDKDRDVVLRDCAGRLQEMAEESEEAATESDSQAQATADAVLRRPEFQYNSEPTWWDRQKAKWLGWLMRLFDGLSEFGAKTPILAPLMEALLIGGAAVGLVVFLIRVAARQRRLASLSAGAVQAVAWEREATDWAQMAARHAEAEEWREAVHCLYWSAIVLLESRRAWRHNPSRTPREYVRLLKPGSAQQQGLRGLTQIFERVWYGFGDADRAKYERARESYDRLALSDAATAPATELTVEAA